MLDLLMLALQGIFILLVIVFAVGLTFWTIAKILDVFTQPVEGPRKKLLGQLGRVTVPIGDAHKGKVVVWGEIWDALPAEPLGDGYEIEKDTEVRLEAFDSMDERVVRVRPVDRSR